MFAIITEYHDPAFNLALEEHLLRSLPAGHPGYFLLWQNGPSVIVGRHQCAAEEIGTEYVKKTGLAVIRRITGGGAVYHDLGNLNFSFIFHCGPEIKPDLKPRMEQIREGLKLVGASVEVTGRNDLEAAGRKISGNAQTVIGGNALVHGTLLVNADMERLAQALKPDKSKIKSKGIASVRARVGNLADYWAPGTSLEELKKHLAAVCASRVGALTKTDIEAAHSLADKKYRRNEWNFGASPPFNLEKRRRFPWGEVVLRLAIRSNRIASCRIHGDFFGWADISALETSLEGCELTAQAIKNALAGFDLRAYFHGGDNAELLAFFTEGQPA